MMEKVRAVFPLPSMVVLLAIGYIDLVMTASLHALGLIVEVNPIMRPVIEHSEYLFAFAKGGTLVLAWVVLLRFVPTHREFVDRMCWIGTALYIGLWCTIFFAHH